MNSGDMGRIKLLNLIDTFREINRSAKGGLAGRS